MAGSHTAILVLCIALICGCGTTEPPSVGSIASEEREIERRALLDLRRTDNAPTGPIPSSLVDAPALDVRCVGKRGPARQLTLFPKVGLGVRVQ